MHWLSWKHHIDLGPRDLHLCCVGNAAFWIIVHRRSIWKWWRPTMELQNLWAFFYASVSNNLRWMDRATLGLHESKISSCSIVLYTCVHHWQFYCKYSSQLSSVFCACIPWIGAKVLFPNSSYWEVSLKYFKIPVMSRLFVVKVD